jgi:biotin carboxyl carrier protein
MKRYQITMEGQTFAVQVLSDPRQAQVQVEVDGRAFTVDVEASPDKAETGSGPETSAPPATAETLAPAVAASDRVLAAPLPGTVTSIAVRPGQRVAPGDELLVIEAMKMNNVIRAPREGTVATIHLAEGQRVAHGQALLEYAD